MDSRIRQHMKTVMRSSRNVDWGIRRPGRMAIISLGCLVAAFLSGRSYYSLVFVAAALVLGVFAVYLWPYPRRRSTGRARSKRRPERQLEPRPFLSAGGSFYQGRGRRRLQRGCFLAQASAARVGRSLARRNAQAPSSAGARRGCWNQSS